MISPFRPGEESLPLTTAAKRLGVNYGTVRRWVLTKLLDYTKIGGRYRFTPHDWERFIERCNGIKLPDGERSSAQRERDQAEAIRQCEELGI